MGSQRGLQRRPLTVESAIMAYADDLRARKGEAAARELIGRKTEIGWRGGRVAWAADRTRQAFPLADLTTAQLTNWRNSLDRSRRR